MSSVKFPELSDLRRISKQLQLGCDNDELQHYLDYMKKDLLPSYNRVEKLIGPSLMVTYPRLPGHKPLPENNYNNTWAWKCDIPGAKSGKLSGKKIGIKDNIAVAGIPMMNGARQMEGYVPDFDATVVSRILDAGGRIVGKTNCEHHCFSGNSFTSCNGPTLHPHNPLHTSGGSSSGNAVAIVSGEVDMAVGADQGGSIRFPSSYCGIVGLKPTWGLVPYTGALGQDVTIDHLGPMARTVADCALLLEVIAGYDNGKDSRQRSMPKTIPEYTKQLTGDVRGMRVGVLVEGFRCCLPEVVDQVKTGIELLKSAGVVAEETSVPMHSMNLTIISPIAFEDFFHQLHGTSTHEKGFYPIAMLEAVHGGCVLKPQDFTTDFKFGKMVGAYVKQIYGNKFYAKAQNLNLKLTAAYDEALHKYDVLVMPTTPFPAPLLPKKDASLIERFEVGRGVHRNTMAFNVTGHPAISVPCGTVQGLPVGMMFVGRKFDETTLLQVAHAFETLHDLKR